MRKTIVSAVAAAAAAAAMGGTGLAIAGTHSGLSGTENFQMMSTSATATTDSLIAHGVFTGPAVDHESQSGNTAKFVFANGTVSVRHSPGKGTQNFDPKTCLLTIDFHGTYNITGGTGAYAGITGNGKYQLGILAIGARSGGKCTKSKPPVAFHQVINASGPVSLP
jgi:hypothetical protein